MIVVTAGTADYRRIIEAQARKCAEFGYLHVVFDLGGLGMGRPFAVDPADLLPTFNGDSLPPAKFKADLLRIVMLDHGEPNQWVCWLDADCIPLQRFYPVIEQDRPLDIDVAVTLRPRGEVGACGIAALDFLNAGVVWIRNNCPGRAFLTEWREKSIALNTDQGAINECVAPGRNAEWWEASRGNVSWFSRSGARVLVLDAMQWNCWHLPPKPDTRILHFKRGIRGAAVNYL